MSKTSLPHPTSYLAFACLVTELMYAWDVALPIALPPEMLDSLRNHVPAPLLGHQARLHAFLRRTLEADTLARFLAIGLPPVLANNPAWRAHIATEVDLQLCIADERLMRRQFLDLAFNGDGNFKPRRQTVRQVIAGEHFAFSEGNRAQTAKSLNVSTSRLDHACKLSDANVRDGLHGFATQIVRSGKSYIEAVAAEVRRARILNLLWERFVAPERSLRLPDLAALIESNDFLCDYDDLMMQTPLITALPPDIHQQAVATGRGPIFAHARTNMALYLARGGDRAAIPEHLRFLVSQSA